MRLKSKEEKNEGKSSLDEDCKGHYGGATLCRINEGRSSEENP